ncbi:MAG: hypothetical protein HYV07_14640 [Deltaproteobacteria bacterium]|nr:hypothetical protein [Deltaproteobacteria bacterium]
MEWLVVLAVLAVSGAVAFVARRGRKKELTAGASYDWKAAVEASAAQLGGRPAFSGATAQLRAEHLSLTVTVKVEGQTLLAETTQYPDAKPARIFLGASGAVPQSDFAHVPDVELPPAFSLDPPTLLKSDEAARAVGFANGAARDLTLAGRESRAKSASVLCRGGSVTLTLASAQPSPQALITAVEVTARLSGLLGGDAKKAEAALAQLPEPASAKVICAFCGGDRRPEVSWVRCQRCQSPHHAECWATTGHCAKPDCTSAFSEPMS